MAFSLLITLALILTHVERLHFIEIVEIALKVAFRKAYHLLRIQD
jgi:hypothetical protein